MKLIDKMAKIQKEIKDIYYQFIGVHAVNEDGVHMSKELFLENFKDFKVTEGSLRYPVSIEKNYNGALFFAVMDFSELENLKEENLDAYKKIKEEWGKLNE